MMIIPPGILADMVGHAAQHAPIEACGLLAGAGSVVAKSYRLSNVDQSSEHFSLDPKEQFAAARAMRADGLEMMAVYHSHPATPARMSDEDLRLAVAPGLHYVIVSLVDPGKPEVKSFLVKNGRPAEEPTIIEEQG
jgi:proteasome lid subunit RPN8/RPN11